MKPLERRTLNLIAQVHLLEHMIRLWKTRHPKEDLARLEQRFSFDLSTGQFVFVYGPDFRLDGFCTWWRIDEVVRGALQELGDHEPTHLELVTLRDPEAIFVSAMCTRPGHERLAMHLLRQMRQEVLGVRKFLYWHRNRLVERDFGKGVH